MKMIILFFAICFSFTGCENLVLPVSQVWVITFANCNLGTCRTNVTILKGGAISQKDNGVRVVTNGSCSYFAPISGQWIGNIFKFTMNGGGCGQQFQGFTQGTAEGEYGTARKAQGSIPGRLQSEPDYRYLDGNLVVLILLMHKRNNTFPNKVNCSFQYLTMRIKPNPTTWLDC